MSLSYIRITDEEDKLRNILEKGEYRFQVSTIEEKLCKNNINKMLVVELEIYHPTGKVIRIKDWIMLDKENFEYKLRHFSASCGLIKNYEEGSLQVKDFLGTEGQAKIVISEYEKDGEIIKVNRVSDYIKPKDIREELPF